MNDSLAQARTAFIRLYVDDVRARPDDYKTRTRADPEAAAHELIDGLPERGVRELHAALKKEIDLIHKATRTVEDRHVRTARSKLKRVLTEQVNSIRQAIAPLDSRDLTREELAAGRAAAHALCMKLKAIKP